MMDFKGIASYGFNIGKILAMVNIVIACGACLGYACVGDTRRALYWGSAAVLTASVTF